MIVLKGKMQLGGVGGVESFKVVRYKMHDSCI